MKLERKGSTGNKTCLIMLYWIGYGLSWMSAFTQTSYAVEILPEQVSWTVDLRTVSTWNTSLMVMAVSAASETPGFTVRLADSISWSTPVQPLLPGAVPTSKTAFWDVWRFPGSEAPYLSCCTLSQNQRSCTKPSQFGAEYLRIDDFTAIDDSLVRISVSSNGKNTLHIADGQGTEISIKKCEFFPETPLLLIQVLGLIPTFQTSAAEKRLLKVQFLLFSTVSDEKKIFRAIKITYLDAENSAGLSCELQDLNIPAFISAHQQRGFGSPNFLVLNSSGLHTLTVAPKNASDPMSTKILTLHTVLTNKAWDPSAVLYCVTGSTIYYSVDRSGVVQCYDTSPQCRLPYRLGLPGLRYLLQAACHPDHGFAAIGLFGNQSQPEVRGIYSPDPHFQTQNIQTIRSRMLTSLLQSTEPEADPTKLKWSISFFESADQAQFTDHLSDVVLYDLSLHRAVIPMFAQLVITSKPQAFDTKLTLKLDYLAAEASSLQTHNIDLVLPSHTSGSKLSAESTDSSFSPEISQDLTLGLVRQKHHIREVGFVPSTPSINSEIELTQRWSGVASPGYLTETDDQQQIEDVISGPSISVVLLKDKTTGLYTLRLYQVSPEYPDQASLITSYQPADSHDPLLPHSSARLAAAAFSPKRLNQTIAPDTREFQVAVAAQDRYDSFAVQNFVFLVKSVAGRLSVTGASQIQKAHFEERLGDVRALRVEIGALDPSEDTSFLFPLVFYLSPSRALKIRSYRGVRFSFDEMTAYHYVVLQTDPSTKLVLVLVLFTSNKDIRIMSLDYRRGSGFKPSNKDETYKSSRVTEWQIHEGCQYELLKSELRKLGSNASSKSAPLLECTQKPKIYHTSSASTSTCVFASTNAVGTVFELDSIVKRATVRAVTQFPAFESSHYLQITGIVQTEIDQSEATMEFISIMRQVRTTPEGEPTPDSLSLGYFFASIGSQNSYQSCLNHQGFLSGLQPLKSNLKTVKVTVFCSSSAEQKFTILCLFDSKSTDSPKLLHARSGSQFFSLRYSKSPIEEGVSNENRESRMSHLILKNSAILSVPEQQTTSSRQMIAILNSSLLISYPFGVKQTSTVAELMGESALRWLRANTNTQPILPPTSEDTLIVSLVLGLAGLLLFFGLCIFCRMRLKSPAQPVRDAEEELSLSMDHSVLVRNRSTPTAQDLKHKSG